MKNDYMLFRFPEPENVVLCDVVYGFWLVGRKGDKFYTTCVRVKDLGNMDDYLNQEKVANRHNIRQFDGWKRTMHEGT